MKKTGWIIGIVLSSIVVVFLLLLIVVGISDNSNVKTEDDYLSDVEAMALTRRASELFCAGVYYTDKAFSIDPQTTTYDEWNEYVDKADEYWKALDEVLETMKDEIDDETFEQMLKKQDVRKSNPFVTTAYALDSAEIIRIFDGAPAGKRLRTLAKHLGKDMKYAQQALKMANGQITSEAWNDFANTAQKLEAGARGLKTAATTAAFVAGGPTLSATLSGAATVVGGASLVMQITDDSCFVMMGDKYDSSEFVANLQKASDYVAPVAFTAGMLTMDFSKAENAVLAGYNIAENFRGLFQDGKIAGIQFGLKNGKMTSMTFQELEKYRQAQKDGESLSKEIEQLLDMLEALENTPKPELTATPNVSPVPEVTIEPSKEPEIESNTQFTGQYYAAGKFERCDVGATPDFVYTDILYTFNNDGSMTREELEVNDRYDYFIQYFNIKNIDGKPTMVDQYDNIQYILEQQNNYIYLIDPQMNTVQAILSPAEEENTVKDDLSQLVGRWKFIDITDNYGQTPEYRELGWNEEATLQINNDYSFNLTTNEPHYENGKKVNGKYDPIVSDGVIEKREGGFYCSGGWWTRGKLLLHENGYLYIEVGEGDVNYRVYER